MCTGRIQSTRDAQVSRLWQTAILTVFVCLAVLYSVANPILESPDELHHYGFVEHLVRRNELPVQRPGESTVYAQEGSQPPLYYVLGALLIAPIDVRESVADVDRNPHALIGIGLARENYNLLVHSESERWPWRGLSLAVHMLRLFSVTLGALTVWGTYRLGRLLFPTEPALALGAMAFTAFNPMFIYLSSSINNDNLVVCLSTWVLVGCVQTFRQKPTMLQCTVLGTLAGLAAIAKVSGVLLIPFALLALTASHSTTVPAGSVSGQVYTGKPVLRIRDLGRYIRQALVVLGIASIIAGWWYARNLVLYGELTGTKAMLEVFGTRDGPVTLRSLFQEYKGFRMTYWGLLGAVNIIIRPVWAYIVLESVALLGLAGVLRWIANRASRQRWGLRPGTAYSHGLLLLALWIIALHLSLLRWTTLTYASQARLIFPAIGAISLLTIWGVCAWFRPKHWYRVIGAVIAFETAIAIAVPWTTILPAYTAPPPLTIDQIPGEAIPFRTRYGDNIELYAYILEDDVLFPGDSTMVTLYWRALGEIDQDYSVYLHLFGQDGEQVAFRDSLAGMALYPTSRWQAGDVIRDTYQLTVTRGARVPTLARLNVGLYEYDTMERLPVRDGNGREVLQPTLGFIKLAGHGQEPTPTHRLSYTFEGGVRLVGYDLDESNAQPGSDVSLTLYWQTAPLARDYTVFVHLVTPDGRLVGQGDAPPMFGEYPTSYWGQDEWLEDRHVLHIDHDAPTGEKRIVVGLYDIQGQRLPVSTGATSPGDSVEIGTLKIGRP